MLLFAVGSVVFATSSSMNIVVAGRLIQGLGAGGIDVLEEIILADITSLKERPLYLGLLAIPIATRSITGPILGAVFSEFIDWRWIDWVNLPIVGTTFVLAFFFLHLKPINISFGTKLRRLDWIGMALFAVGATAMAIPLSWADALYPWSSWRTIVPLITGILILAIFTIYEKRPAEAVLPYRIFSNITAVSSLITAFIHGMIMYTLLLYLPLFFQAVFLESPLQAAKSMLPICCLVVAFSIIAPVTIELTRRYRLVVWLGWLLTALFSGVWCLVSPIASRTMVNSLQALLGIGIGAIFTSTQVPMQASVRHVDDMGLAVGLLVVFRMFGGLTGMALGSTVFNSIFETSIASLGVLPEEVSVLRDATLAIGFIPKLRNLDQLSPEIMQGIIKAYWKPFRAVWIVLTCLAGAGFITSLFV
jgi:hypothetical protein